MFDLNALFQKVVDKNKPSKKSKDSKATNEDKPAPEDIEFDMKSKLDSVKLYEKINKKLQNTIQQETQKGTAAIQEFAEDREKFESKIDNKQFLLDKFFNPKKKTVTNKRSQLLSSKFRKEKKVFDLKDKRYTYKMFVPLNDAWNLYIRELISSEKSLDSILNKLLKADYHGAHVKILRSKVKTYEGQQGIVLMETLKTFKIITAYDKISTILKKDCIFLIEVMGQTFKIYGWHIQYRPSDRVKAKFKARTFENLEELK